MALLSTVYLSRVQGNIRKQRELLLRALRIKQREFGADHVEVAKVSSSHALVSLGDTYGTSGDVQQQRKLLERALRIQEGYYGEDHREVEAAIEASSHHMLELVI
eukprot:4079450-Amphidinium_carterae.1